jgi:hypothetical protein
MDAFLLIAYIVCLQVIKDYSFESLGVLFLSDMEVSVFVNNQISPQRLNQYRHNLNAVCD